MCKFQTIQSNSLFIIPILLYKIYINWKDNELNRIKYNSLSFIKNGYVLIDSINSKDKRRTWYNILFPILLTHWNKEHENIGFDINNKSTWPVSKDGKYYNSTLTSTDHYHLLPKLFSLSYDSQCIVSYLFDSSLNTVTFGNQTHWKLKLLSNPLNLLISNVIYKPINILFKLLNSLFYNNNNNNNYNKCNLSCNYCGYCANGFDNNKIKLHGAEHGWHITIWPQHSDTDHSKDGVAIPFNTHIDGGENFRYKSGIPVPIDSTTTTNSNIALDNNWTHTAINSKILSMLLWQLAILFTCDTPGYLGIKQGVTGLYQYSHISILNAIIDNSMRSNASISYETYTKAIKNYGNAVSKDRLIQVSIPDGKALLVFGSLAHTGMFASEGMIDRELDREFPRVIENSKITGFITNTNEMNISFDVILNDCLLKSFINNRNKTFISISKDIINNKNNNNNNQIDNDIKIINNDCNYISKLLQN